MGRGGNQVICDFNYVWIKQGGANTNLNTSHADTGIKTRHLCQVFISKLNHTKIIHCHAVCIKQNKTMILFICTKFQIVLFLRFLLKLVNVLLSNKSVIYSFQKYKSF